MDMAAQRKELRGLLDPIGTGNFAAHVRGPGSESLDNYAYLEC